MGFEEYLVLLALVEGPATFEELSAKLYPHFERLGYTAQNRQRKIGEVVWHVQVLTFVERANEKRVLSPRGLSILKDNPLLAFIVNQVAKLTA